VTGEDASVLHVAQISFFLDPQRRGPEQLLHDWPSLVDVAEAAAGAGVRVSVVQACAEARQLTRHGVAYHFVCPDQGTTASSRCHAFIELIDAMQPDVLHVHGLGFPLDVLALTKALPRKPILLQDHANRPPRIWKRVLWRRALSAVSGIAFCAQAQVQPYTRLHLVGPRTTIYEIPESSSRFSPGSKEEARRANGLHGAPCVLWVGHLDDNKDPLTVLEGVSGAIPHLPGLQLWCCYGVAPLLAQVSRRIEADRALKGRVHLLGKVEHDRVQQLMRAADIFVLGSHREGSGYSLIEALACGLPPVVTDIPSFRALTGDGAVGHLWRCGDAKSLTRALTALASRLNSGTSAGVSAHFEKELSFAAVGHKLRRAYTQVLERSSAGQSGHGMRHGDPP
jgi:glycosyltransferase involved in cell wall biosynthesis